MTKTLAGTANFKGVFASAICPMTSSQDVAEDCLARHVASLAAISGVAGLLINGHAGENAFLDRSQARRVLEVARAAAPSTMIVAGINAEASRSAISLAENAEAAGADGLLVFPPYSWSQGSDAEMVVYHHRAIEDSTSLPIVLFQSSVRSGGMVYTQTMLHSLVESRRIVAVKEGSWETSAYEATRDAVKALRPDIAVLASGDEHLFPCFVLGSEGTMVSLAAIVPELIVALDQAVRDRDIDRALECHQRITPLSRAVYRAGPVGKVAARIKTCLAMLGRISNSAWVSPTGPLSADEVEALRHGLVAAGLGQVGNGGQTRGLRVAYEG